MLKPLFVILLSAMLLSACESIQQPAEKDQQTDSIGSNQNANTMNILSETEKSDGWQLLFDGKSKNGWHVFSNATDGSAWKVANGMLYLDPTETSDSQTSGGGDLVSEWEFENFHLQLEWKLDSGGNSGVMFYVKEEDKYERTWHTGPEMQVLDNNAHKDAKIIKHRAGDLYDLITSSPETVKPAGEWNLAEIISNEGKLEFRMNGTSVLRTTLWDDNWRKLVAESKFKVMPDFGTFRSGHFALQDHGDPVWFRNIKVKKI